MPETEKPARRIGKASTANQESSAETVKTI